MGIGSYAPTAFIYISKGMLKPQHKTQPTKMAMMGGGVEEGTLPFQYIYIYIYIYIYVAFVGLDNRLYKMRGTCIKKEYNSIVLSPWIFFNHTNRC